MTSKASTAPEPSPEDKSNDSGEGSGVHTGRRRPANYVRRAKAMQTLRTARTLPNKVFPQWLRTFLVVFLWLGSVPLYVSVIAPYVAYMSATIMTVGLAVFSGLAPHLWPSRTAPWRTVAWAWVTSMLIGMTVLTMDWGRYSVTVATLVGFTIVVGRANQNARRLIDLFKTWRVMR